MKRNLIVVLVFVVGITAMIWSGVIAYKARKASAALPAMPTMPMQSQGQMQIPGAHGSTPGAADPDSPEAQGLKDFRGKPAPAFTLKTPDGKPVSLSDYKGKAVLINFWATWCGPCKLEMPWLINLQKKYASQGFTVLGISEDDGPVKNVSAFTSKIGVNYPVLMGDDKVSKAYGGIEFLPTSFYVRRDGKVAFEVGGLISESDMEADVKKLLATKGDGV